MSKSLETFWLFSFSNPRWKIKRAPWINEASLCYGVFLVTVPCFLLRTVFPSADAVQGYAVIFTVTISYWILGGRYCPGIQSGYSFTPWSVMKKQLIAMVNLFVIGLIVSYHETPWFLQSGMTRESVWQLLWLGTTLFFGYILPFIGTVRLLLWCVRLGTREYKQEATA
jgi:predicted permease